jgi:hypothetical protein
MANFKYGNPYMPGTPEFYAYQKADVAPDLGFSMAPRIDGPRPELGLAPYGPGYASTYPNPGGIDSGQDLPMMYGYDSTIGVPQTQVDPLSISPGGTNEVTEIGIPQTDYTGGFETRALEDPGVSGPFMPDEYKTAPPPSEGAETPEKPKTTETGDDAAGQEKSFDGAGLATGVGQIAGGITNIVMGARALKDVDIAGAETGVREAYATRPGLGTPVEFYNMQKEAYDQRLMAMRVEDINRGLATNVAAAQQYGARGLGATLAATAQAQRAQQQEVLQQQRLQTSALGALASAREREIQRREQRATFDIGMAYDQLKAEQAREQYARQQIAQGIVGTAAGIARTAVTFGAEQGAKVTPGEFSHDTNPIDIVQEGTKIGEMTGGEYIFNPRQAKQMAREANKGNSPLHKFVRKTLNKFHKDAEKYEGK